MALQASIHLIQQHEQLTASNSYTTWGLTMDSRHASQLQQS